MSEEQEKQESQKTLVAFVAGLLIGGLLVWVFGGAPEQKDEVSKKVDAPSEIQKEETKEISSEETAAEVVEEKKVMQTGNGAVDVRNQSAGNSVALESITFPNDEGWVGVRDYVNGQPAGLLGVVRFSKEQELIPEEVVLQRATQAGKTYAVVFYTESGDRKFSLANDVQVDGVLSTFVAQ